MDTATNGSEEEKSAIGNDTGGMQVQVPPTAQQSDSIKTATAELSSLADQLHAAIERSRDAESKVGSLLDSIRSSAQLASEQAKSELDAQVNSLRTEAASFAEQTNSAKEMIARLSNLTTEAQTLIGQFKESGLQAAAVLESTRSAATAAAEHAGRIEALKTQVEQSAQIAATRSEHIEEGRKYVDAKRAEVDAIANAARQSATNAESHSTASKSSLDKLNAVHVSAQKLKADAESNAEATQAARSAADGYALSTKQLADTAEAIQARVAQYEEKLTDLQRAAEQQRKMIDELLLGATNAGLASAFDTRSKAFKRPELVWQTVFIGSLGGLLVLAFYEARAFGADTPAPQWQELARMLVHRTPFLVPLIWLAIHAARQAAFAKRMEEEYAFKATISTSFEGYRRQMAEVSKDLTPDSPLSRLCTDTLVNISTPPSLIYDKHRMDPTPGTAASDIVTPIVEGVSKVLKEKLPDLKG